MFANDFCFDRSQYELRELNIKRRELDRNSLLFI